jgi:hypothetical protein
VSRSYRLVGRWSQYHYYFALENDASRGKGWGSVKTAQPELLKSENGYIDPERTTRDWETRGRLKKARILREDLNLREIRFLIGRDGDFLILSLSSQE